MTLFEARLDKAPAKPGRDLCQNTRRDGSDSNPATNREETRGRNCSTIPAGLQSKYLIGDI